MIKKYILYITLAFVAVGIISVAAPVASSVSAQEKTEGLQCGILPKALCTAATEGDKDTIEETGTWKLLNLVIVIMTAGAGILAIGGIIYGAVMYTTAGGNQEQVKKARGILTNVVIGIVAFAAMFALLQWLLPGGAW